MHGTNNPRCDQRPKSANHPHAVNRNGLSPFGLKDDNAALVQLATIALHVFEQVVRDAVKAALNEKVSVPTTPLASRDLALTITVREYSARTGLSISFIRGQIATGALPSIKVGSRRLIRAAEAEHFLNSRSATQTGG
jgi:excisionase family DNA binding protein